MTTYKISDFCIDPSLKYSIFSFAQIYFNEFWNGSHGNSFGRGPQHSMLVETSTSKKPPITEIYIFMIHVPRGLKKGKNENPPVSLIGNFGNFFWNFKLRFCMFDDFRVSVKGKIWRKFLRKNWPIHRNFLKLFFPDPAEICSVDRP